MGYWSEAPEAREQLVLYSRRLDEAIPAGHAVRLLDEILGRLDWSDWEAEYHGRIGQPPIHPRVLCGVILYGLMKRVRSSRALEEALQVRLDFRWLAEGRTIDHTTLSEFRRGRRESLKRLFQQIGVVARQAGLLPLAQLAFDGTRMRANNRRSGTRATSDLAELKAALAKKYTELEQRHEAQDQAEGDTASLPQELADLRRRQAEIDAALAEVKRAEDAQETVPGRIPLTDPQARVTPNKDGGFSPNYTPLATVDTAYGLIVAADVIATTDEAPELVKQLDAVGQTFGLSVLPREMLADGMMNTGGTLAALEERGVTLYAPSGESLDNPARREDPTSAVPQEAWDRLPTLSSKKGKPAQLSKEAFVYDASRECYWCPAGKALQPEQTTSEKNQRGQRVSRTRYKAQEKDCAGCPLRERCLGSKAKRREVSRYETDVLSEALARRMATPEAQAKYARRREVAERPFAVIKQQFNARAFLTRGLEQVRQEWTWLAIAFNLERLAALLWSRAGPPKPSSLLAA